MESNTNETRGESSKVKISNLRTCMNIQMLAFPLGQNKGEWQHEEDSESDQPDAGTRKNWWEMERQE